MKLSIVIPTLEEAATIGGCLEGERSLPEMMAHEHEGLWIVVDGEDRGLQGRVGHFLLLCDSGRLSTQSVGAHCGSRLARPAEALLQ